MQSIIALKFLSLNGRFSNEPTLIFLSFVLSFFFRIFNFNLSIAFSELSTADTLKFCSIRKKKFEPVPLPRSKTFIFFLSEYFSFLKKDK